MLNSRIGAVIKEANLRISLNLASSRVADCSSALRLLFFSAGTIIKEANLRISLNLASSRVAD